MLHTVKDKFDILCLQEPHFDFQELTRATPVWRVVMPSRYVRKEGRPRREDVPRAIILVHERISTNGWTQIDLDSLDLVGIQLKAEGGVVNLYNMYNDCTHSETLQKMEAHLQRREVEETANVERLMEGDIWLGDFNRHHPMWDSAKNSRLFTRAALTEAQELISILADYDMTMALPEGIPTIRNSRGGFTRPDNVFISNDIAGWVTKCMTVPEDRPPQADHFPIFTEIDLPVRQNEETPAWNYQLTDWTEFRSELSKQLDAMPPSTNINAKEELNNVLDRLEKAILRTVEKVVPRRRPSPYAKRWWTKELTQLRQDMRQKARRAYDHRDWPLHSSHEEARQARNKFTNQMKKTKTEHWEDWLENVNESSIWNTHNFTKQPATDGGKVRIPALKKMDEHGQTVEVLDNEEKSHILHKAFFYEPPDNPGIDPMHQYPEPAFLFEEITDSQIIRVAQGLNAYKAPGLNGIGNSVLTHCVDILITHLGPIFRATFKLKHYPERWKRFNTSVLRKPGKPDYTVPGAYRPIALLDVIAKLLAACVKETLEYHTDRLHLLPQRQFARPGCTTTDSLHLLVDFIKKAWRQKKEVIAMFLDVKAAFPTTVIPVLIHNMRDIGIPREYTDWILEKMTGRETVISFDDFKSMPIPVKSGLDQGCNLSGFNYRCYNASQIKGSIGRKDELATNYADDAICATAAVSLQVAADKMTTLFNRPLGPKDWATTHHSTYDFAKFVAVGFTRRRVGDPQRPGRTTRQGPTRIVLNDNHTITTVNSHKFLGVILDRELRFKEHAAYATGKGTKWVLQTRRLAKMAKGMEGEFTRRLFYAVAAKRMLYAADVWCSIGVDGSGKETTRGMDGVIKKLESVQHQAAIQITGALKDTPTDLLFAHADMLPMRELIKSACQDAALRIATLPKHHPIASIAKKAIQHNPKSHPSPLNNIMHISKIRTNTLETIDTIRKGPRWRSPLKTEILPSKEEALRAEKEREVDVKVYSDGSGHDGGIGAAAILAYGHRQLKVARHFLGPATEHTVYEAECVGQLLAMGLLQKEMADISGADTAVLVDNQSSITVHHGRKPRPGSYIIDSIRETHIKVRNKHHGIRIRIHWIPGHKDVALNEKVDAEAKKAAEGAHNNINNRVGILTKPLPISRSAKKQALRAKTKQSYIRHFKSLPRYKKIERIDPSAPSNKFRKMTASMTRRQKSILIQLRTGHIPLQAYLHKIHKAETPICQQCHEEPETVSHYLRRCQKYKEQRKVLKESTGERDDISWDVLGRPQTIRQVLKFVADTRRFEETHGDLRPREEEVDQDAEALGGATWT